MVIGLGGGEFVLVGYCIVSVLYTFNLVHLFSTEEASGRLFSGWQLCVEVGDGEIKTHYRHLLKDKEVLELETFTVVRGADITGSRIGR